MAPGAIVVGTGFGCRVHVPALRAAGFEVLALVGRDVERTQRRAARLDVPHACASLDDALVIAGTDVVTIATPPSTHASLAIAAARAGRHVICEKPFALDAAQADEMLRAATDAGVTHMVGHEFRFAPERATIGRVIGQGVIGVPRLVSLVQFVSLVAGNDARMPGWWFDPAHGGGWLGASGSHVVDQVRAWLGEFASVSATLPAVGGRGADDSFVVRFRLRNGADGVLVQSAAVWGDPRGHTVVAGSAGTVGADGDGPWFADASGRRPVEVPPDLALAEPPSGRASDARERFTHLELGPYTRLCETLRAAMEGRPAPSPVAAATFVDGAAEMAVLDAIRISAAAGGSLVPVAPT